MSQVLILNHAEVTGMLPMAECIRLMREAFTALGSGQAFQPLRSAVRPPGVAGVLGMMPAYLASPRPALGMKTLAVFHGNRAVGLDSHQGAVLLYSAENGELQAILSASAITAIRTAAASGLATELLARTNANSLALIGTGIEGRTHLEAMACARTLGSCRVASRLFANAQNFAAEFSGRYGFPVTAVETVEAALEGADLIATTTNAKQPIVERDWIAPGAHLNVVGSSIPTTREVDGETLAASSLFVDRRESTLNEAGDFLLAQAEGLVGPDHIQAELGEILLGTHPGRTSTDEITLFKSLGLGIEDVACAAYLYDKAKDARNGTWVDF
ncbi:MAG: ornithine cyclodeaminase family protein [Pyrinomonadaceae bacterium]